MTGEGLPTMTYPTSGKSSANFTNTIGSQNITFSIDGRMPESSNTPFKLYLTVNNIDQSCVQITSTGMYQLFLPNAVSSPSTITISIDGGTC